MSVLDVSLREDLSRPEAYEAVLKRVAAPQLIETQISWVFIHEKDVFKVKKPVELGFVDFRSLERRRAACEAEVRLNARLAPGVYRGIFPVCGEPNGRAHVAASGTIVDWAVHMRRLDDDTRADRILERGELSQRCVEAIAKRLAEFHENASVASEADRFGDRATVESQVEENFDQTADLLAKYLQPSEAHSNTFGQRLHGRRI